MIVSPDKDVIVGVGGQVSAPLVDSQNYVITSGMSSISNYAQWGNDLIVQFSSGEELRINNFFINGPAFHKLMIVENGNRIEVDFTKAITNQGDGIDDSLIQYTQLGESLSVTTLLGILGGVAVGGAGIYSVFGKSSDDKGDSYTAPTATFGRPEAPDTEIINDDKNPTEVIRSGASTNDNTPTLQGEDATPGAQIAIKVNGGDPVYVTVGQDGKWSYTFPQLADGVYNVVVTQIGTNGATSEETSLQFTVDTIAPDVPQLETVNDNVTPTGTITNGGITNDATPEFKGTAEAGSKISIYVDGTVVGTTTTGTDGKWSIELGTNLSDGVHRVQITATDAAGNESGKTSEFSFTVDTIAPSAISATSIYWSDANGGDATQFTTGNSVTTTARKIVLSGIANAVGAGYDAKWIEIFDNGISIGRAEIGTDGKWQFSPENDLSLGSHNFSFEAIDAAGNRSSRTNVAQFIVSAAATPTSADAADTSSTPDDGSASASADTDSSDNNTDDNSGNARSAAVNPSSSDDVQSDDSASSQQSDTSSSSSDNSANEFSYRLGNFLDESDATASGQASSSEDSQNADSASASDASANDSITPTSDILGEIGIDVSDNDSQAADVQSADSQNTDGEVNSDQNSNSQADDVQADNAQADGAGADEVQVADNQASNDASDLTIDDLLDGDTSVANNESYSDIPAFDAYSSSQMPNIYDEQHLSYV
ncbi:Ig-like domain-containing protein [Bartonella sp. HY329]|uniref:Ig-like domain-containing protein n=1 Tax=unclassified Bartonella TaxID=2645622 RepID=UPI0021C795C3|nr:MULTISPECIES: Ig-like domain-containing protein [unclassified Bartonella]UXM96178.1 Ig-like domain-containing protein [Bartonella sp. HY329]UXN10502.1 Ig-like domain-containing protein [Bartonella sp. HY328]